jgi:multiple sugar transport system permease protein
MLNDNGRNRTLLYLGLGLFAAWALLPYAWVFRTSVLESFAAIDPNAGYVPAFDKFTPVAFLDVWDRFNFVRYFTNSIIVSIGATVISLVFAIPGAYAFARLDFPGRKLLFYTAVFTIMFPWIVLTIPVYQVFQWLEMIDTLEAVIIALSIFVLPQAIWLLQGFFRQGIPRNIEEAALLDGHSELTAFLRIVLPLSLPAVAAAGLFSFLIAWNNFLWVFILTSGEQNRTATVAIHFILGSDVMRQWNVLMASAILLIIPPVLFYTLAQRYVGEGLGGAY